MSGEAAGAKFSLGSFPAARALYLSQMALVSSSMKDSISAGSFSSAGFAVLRLYSDGRVGFLMFCGVACLRAVYCMHDFIGGDEADVDADD